MIEVFDDYLPKEMYQKTRDVLLGDTFPWFYCDRVLDPQDPYSVSGDDAKNIFQMTHTFYYQWEYCSAFGPLVTPIMEHMNIFQPLRVKANLTYKADQNYETGWHIDFKLGGKPQKCKTALLYFTTTNGPTKFKSDGDDIVVDCVENRLVVFDNCDENLHCGTMATDELRRVVINFNWFEF